MMTSEPVTTWGRAWGLAGVLVFLLSAVWRLTPDVHEVLSADNGLEAYLLLAVLLPAMLYLEGYRGFYLGFSPRVVSRGKALSYQTNMLYHIFAPLFCMGFIGSTLRRKAVLFVVTLSIVALVVWVRGLNQPWRWVVDVSVALALFYGAVSIVWLAYKDWSDAGFLCNPEVPGD